MDAFIISEHVNVLCSSSGFMSVTHKHPQFMRDPNICDIKHLN